MTEVRSSRGRVVALSGGIGGAKLALGLSRVLGDGDLVVVANTGDDFTHLGLAISPDVDTLLYTLAGLADPERGWGRRDETWTFMAALAALGGETWFQLGDGDLATHVERTRRLAAGEGLTAVTDGFRRRLGIVAAILPMSDDPVRTELLTAEGWLAFQDYFVRRRCEPAISDLRFSGAQTARVPDAVVSAFRDPGLRAVVICPSNPFISIDPILAVPGLRELIEAADAPVIAVSPVIAGRAVKGPTAKMMRELGFAVSAGTVGRRYADLIDAYVIDRADEGAVSLPGLAIVAAGTLMVSLDDRERLARTVLATADALA